MALVIGSIGSSPSSKHCLSSGLERTLCALLRRDILASEPPLSGCASLAALRLRGWKVGWLEMMMMIKEGGGRTRLFLSF